MGASGQDGRHHARTGPIRQPIRQEDDRGWRSVPLAFGATKVTSQICIGYHEGGRLVPPIVDCPPLTDGWLMDAASHGSGTTQT
jgi:hypothetical protein